MGKLSFLPCRNLSDTFVDYTVVSFYSRVPQFIAKKVFLYILKILLYLSTETPPVSTLLRETLWETPVGFETETRGMD